MSAQTNHITGIKMKDSKNAKKAPITPVDIFEMDGFCATEEKLTEKERFELDRLTVKNVNKIKDENGCPIFDFKLCLDKKVVAIIASDKYGASSNVYFQGEGKALMSEFVEKSNWGSRIHELLYNEKEHSDCLQTVVDKLANAPITLWEQKKALASINRKTKKALIIGTLEKQRKISWGKNSLEDVKNTIGGQASLETQLKKILDESNEGDVLFNTSKQLKSLGLSSFIGTHSAIKY